MHGVNKVGECAARMMDVLERDFGDKQVPAVVDVAVVVMVEHEVNGENVSQIRYFCSTPYRHRQYGLLEFAARSLLKPDQS